MIVALLTCHGRRELTLRALRSFFAQRLPAAADLRAVVCDDGSRDGTAFAVRALDRRICVFRASGNLFWCRGMHAAWRVATQFAPQHYLWLNDDVELDPDALARLLAAGGNERIAVGPTRDPDSGMVSYGGLRRASPLRPLRLRLMPEQSAPATCDTFHGNCVLVPAAIAARIGRIDPIFSHGMGDNDYGLRASGAGLPPIVVPGTIGICRRNPVLGTWRDATAPLRTRWRSLVSRKGLPPTDWMRFAWRHAGWLGLAVWSWTYLSILLPRRRPPC